MLNGIIEFLEYFNVFNMVLKIDYYEWFFCVWFWSFVDEGVIDVWIGVEGVCLLSGNRWNFIIILRNLDN